MEINNQVKYQTLTEEASSKKNFENEEEINNKEEINLDYLTDGFDLDFYYSENINLCDNCVALRGQFRIMIDKCKEFIEERDKAEKENKKINQQNKELVNIIEDMKKEKRKLKNKNKELKELIKQYKDDINELNQRLLLKAEELKIICEKLHKKENNLKKNENIKKINDRFNDLEKLKNPLEDKNNNMKVNEKNNNIISENITDNEINSERPNQQKTISLTNQNESNQILNKDNELKRRKSFSFDEKNSDYFFSNKTEEINPEINIEDIDSFDFETINSKIINNNDEIEFLKSLFFQNSNNKINSKIKKIEFKLIYRTSEHGDISEFHKRCDNISETIIIIKTKKKWIFGGYTSLAWNPDLGSEKIDEESFIFSLNLRKVFEFKSNNNNYSILCNKYKGPCFGGMFNIQENILKKKQYFIENCSGKEINGGENEFEIQELEVFHIIKEN